MSPEEALAFVREHEVVLESAAGPVPSLAEAVAGERIRGSWWGHPTSRAIFAATRAVRDAKDVLTCRLVGGKITFVHARLWPALVRVSGRFPESRLARLREVHTETGRHVTEEEPFADWVSPELEREAESLTEAEALEALGAWYAETS